MTEDLGPKVKSITPLTFADHHDFSRSDMRTLNEAYKAMPQPKCIDGSLKNMPKSGITTKNNVSNSCENSAKPNLLRNPTNSLRKPHK